MKLYKQEVQDMNIRVTKTRTMRYGKSCIKNVNVLLGTAEGKRPLGRTRCRK
jgi:hypothetical protein